MNRNVFLLTSIPDQSSFVPLVKDLGRVPGVVSWQAIDGHANLLVMVEGSSDPVFDHLHHTAGNTAVTLCEVMSPATLPPVILSDRCYSWVFADVEPEKLTAVRNRLSSVEGVDLEIEVRGGCNLIALVSGATLDEVDRIISSKIQILDGLLRLKRNRVINLTSM